ncbi:MAG: hypothetical protein HQ596_05965 [Candidatus Saganbacteria bacterium]|nr:hypothetical protein [Candidatus Saganbacteria bacterium]
MLFRKATKAPVRLIAVHPFGAKTAAFIRALKSQPTLDVEVVENTSLPHFEYNYAGYSVKGYSHKRADEILRRHLDYYRQQLGIAKRKQQLPALASGRFHEFSAPFRVGLKEIFEVDPINASVDHHLDCGAPRSTAAGFWSWLILKEHIRGDSLTVFGPPAQNRILTNNRFSFDVFPEDTEVPPITEIEIGTLSQMADRVVETMRNCLDADFDRERDDAFALVEDRFTCRRAKTDNPFAPSKEGLWQTALKCTLRMIIDEKWMRFLGVNFGISHQEYRPQPGESVFVSLDGDVNYDMATFALLFLALRGTEGSVKLSGFHVCELESPLCKFNPSDLAPTMANNLISTYT